MMHKLLEQSHNRAIHQFKRPNNSTRPFQPVMAAFASHENLFGGNHALNLSAAPGGSRLLSVAMTMAICCSALRPLICRKESSTKDSYDASENDCGGGAPTASAILQLKRQMNSRSKNVSW